MIGKKLGSAAHASASLCLPLALSFGLALGLGTPGLGSAQEPPASQPPQTTPEPEATPEEAEPFEPAPAPPPMVDEPIRRPGPSIATSGTSCALSGRYDFDAGWSARWANPELASADDIGPVDVELEITRRKGSYRLVFNDEFDELSLGAWGTGARWADFFIGWNKRHIAGNDDEAIKVTDDLVALDGTTIAEQLRSELIYGDRDAYLHEVANGCLRLRSYPSPSRSTVYGFRYLAGMISSELSHAQTHGYWEMRLRMANVPTGHHLAIWLMPADGSWPPEIDLLETIGRHPSLLGADLKARNRRTPGINFYSTPRASDEWYTLGFEWTPRRMIWTFNGRAIRSHSSFGVTNPMALIVTWEIGSVWPGNPNAATIWPGELVLDYVRIYEPIEDEE